MLGGLLSGCSVLQSGTDELLLIPTVHRPELIVRGLGNDGGMDGRLREHQCLSRTRLVMALQSHWEGRRFSNGSHMWIPLKKNKFCRLLVVA